MSREIKFRALRTDGKGWVYGCYRFVNVIEGKKHLISDWFGNEIEVIPETVGQFTGLKDRNGKEIYEGDVISISSRGFDFECKVTYDKQLIPVGEKSKGWEHMLYSPYWEECEIIGNIHSNE